MDIHLTQIYKPVPQLHRTGFSLLPATKGSNKGASTRKCLICMAERTGFEFVNGATALIKSMTYVTIRPGIPPISTCFPHQKEHKWSGARLKKASSGLICRCPVGQK